MIKKINDKRGALGHFDARKGNGNHIFDPPIDS